MEIDHSNDSTNMIFYTSFALNRAFEDLGLSEIKDCGSNSLDLFPGLEPSFTIEPFGIDLADGHCLKVLL